MDFLVRAVIDQSELFNSISKSTVQSELFRTVLNRCVYLRTETILTVTFVLLTLTVVY